MANGKYTGIISWVVAELMVLQLITVLWRGGGWGEEKWRADAYNVVVSFG